jgi:hypothetical protein
MFVAARPSEISVADQSLVSSARESNSAEGLGSGPCHGVSVTVEHGQLPSSSAHQSTRTKADKQATRHIELEAQAIAMKNSISRQGEIWRLLAPLQDSQAPDVKLPCHSLGHPQNPQFKGRVEFLADIHAALYLAKGGETEKSQRIYSLYGLGGVGKTQIAIAYAHSHQDDYRALFWIAADTELKVISDIRTAVTKLGLVTKDSKDDDKTVAAKFKEWLEETGTCSPGIARTRVG